MKKWIFIPIMMITLLGCKKNKPKDEPQNVPPSLESSIENALRYTWNFNYFVHHEYGNATTTDSVAGVLGDYMRFDPNNYCVSFWNSAKDSVTYRVIADSNIIYVGDTFKIITLNSSTCKLKNTNFSELPTSDNILLLTK